MLQVKIKRLYPDAILPEYKTDGAAGMDLYAHSVVERPWGWEVGTGIAIELPNGYEAQVRPRSGLARMGAAAVFGTIDADYRGEISVTVLRTWDNPGIVNIQGSSIWGHRGSRIAQLVIAPVPRVQWIEVDELSETVRGGKGFGSTGR